MKREISQSLSIRQRSTDNYWFLEEEEPLWGRCHMIGCSVQISQPWNHLHTKNKKKDIRGSTYIYMNAYHTYVFNIYHHKASISLRQTWKGSREDNWKELRMGESGEKWCNYISIQTLKVKKRKVASVNKDLHEFIREYLVFLLNFIFFSCCYLRANLIYLRLATN